MFERYTEKARRVIFFARYEASNFGKLEIETEHILLGLIREDLPLLQSFLGSDFSDNPIRKQIEDPTGVRPKVSTSKNLPLSHGSKRVLFFTAQEADRLCSDSIGPEHILFGLLQEKDSLAAQILSARGLRFDAISPISQLSPVEQQRWIASRRRRQQIYRWARVVSGVLIVLFGLFFFQIASKMSMRNLSHADAVFYAISFPVLSAAVGALVFWRYRRGQLARKKAVRYLIVMTAFFFAGAGMIFSGLR